MKIYHVEQSSLEWLALRSGVVTASEADSLVSPTFEVRKGAMPASYLAQKLAEKWIGGPLPGFMGVDMELGKILETEAIPAYEFENSATVERVGFITNDAGTIGCSPDGLLGTDGGLELKCPLAATHVKYLLAGELPGDYAVQVQFSLWVTRRNHWKFMSYRRSFPSMLLTVQPDAKAFKAFDDAIPPFLEKMNAGWKKLVEMNGSEPAKNSFREDVINPKVEPKPDSEHDVIP